MAMMGAWCLELLVVNLETPVIFLATMNISNMLVRYVRQPAPAPATVHIISSSDDPTSSV